MVTYFLYLIASFFLRIIPDTAAWRSAAFLSLFFYVFKSRARINVKLNYDAIGIKDGNAFLVFKYFSRTIADFLRLPYLKREEINRLCSIKGLEHLDEALEEGRGLVLFTPHLGPWEVAGAVLALRGYRLHTVALEHPSNKVTRFFSERRRLWGIRDYTPGESAGNLLQALRNNEIIVLLVDRNFTARGLKLRLFGREALLPDGHIVLSTRANSPLLPCWCYYNEEGTIEAFIGDQVKPPGGKTSPGDIGKACLERIEKYIMAHPEQWFAFDHLWPEDTHAR